MNQLEILLLTTYSKKNELHFDILGKYGHKVLVKEISQAFQVLKSFDFDIVIIDIEFSQSEEINIVNYIKTNTPRIEILIVTDVSNIDKATIALRNGASLYLLKPLSANDIIRIVQKLGEKISRESEYIEFEQKVLSDLMAGNSQMEKILKLSAKVAPTSSTVMLNGESGTGKEFFAKIIHKLSRRTEGTFVPVNCGAIPDTLFESEMFGHTKGSFTGASSDKVGVVETAHMGTLFLDEVGELSLQSQVKLLRFIQEHTYRPVGSAEEKTVNSRIIAATNRDLPQMIKDGTFREDLYYRLTVFTMTLPPLRNRKETLPSLFRLFVLRNNEALGKNVNRISQSAEAILAAYHYPGNIRELENIIEHAVILAEGDEITERNLPEYLQKPTMVLPLSTEELQKNNITSPPLALPSPEESELEPSVQTNRPLELCYKNNNETKEYKPLQDIEKEYIKYILEEHKFNYSESAKVLGISRSTLWRKIKLFDIETE